MSSIQSQGESWTLMLSSGRGLLNKMGSEKSSFSLNWWTKIVWCHSAQTLTQALINNIVVLDVFPLAHNYTAKKSKTEK